MSKNKAWIQYTKQGKIVPGSLIVSPKRPVNGVWYEVITDICCDTEPPFGVISGKQKAFVKYDASGNIVPGSLILTDNKLPKPGIWKEVYINICCSTFPTYDTTLRLTWDNSFDIPVVDPLNVAQWNAFFNLPANGIPFTSVSIDPFVNPASVLLEGGFNINVLNGLFDNSNIIEVIDNGSLATLGSAAFQFSTIQSFSSTSLTSFGDVSFYSCLQLTTVVAPLAVSVGNGAFGDCQFLTSIDLPSVIYGDNYCFNNTYRATSVNLPALLYIGFQGLRQCGKNISAPSTINLSSCTNLGGTVGNNQMFSGITGKTRTLIVPAALMTCNGGLPDGDIQALQSANTVTIITT